MKIAVGTSGLNTDIAPAMLPPDALTGGVNFLCTQGCVRAPTMRLKVMNLSIEPLWHFVWTTADNVDKVIISNGVKVHLYDADGTEHDITPDAGDFTAGCKVTFTDLNTLLVVNSNEDGPFSYDPTTKKLVALKGWPTAWRCEVMSSVRYNLVALNLTEGSDRLPQKLRWSNSAADGDLPTQWTPALTNDAGDDLLGESGGHIIGARQFKDSLWIGKSDSLYEMSYIGGNFVFQNSRRSGDIGITSPLAIVGAKNQLAILSRDDIYTFDGSNAKSLTDNRINNKILELSDNGSFDYVEMAYSPNQDLLFIDAVGTGRTADQSLIYSYIDNTWSLVSFGALYGFDLAALTSDTDPELVCYRENKDGDYVIERFTNVYDEALEGDYVLVAGEAEREGISLDAPLMVEKVMPILRGQKLRLEFGVSRAQDAPYRWTPIYEVDPPAKQFIPVRMVGRYFAWRVSATARQPWYLDGLDIRVQPAGDRD